MKTKLVPIGNSKGVRIPSAILKQCDFENQVELEVDKDKIIIKPVKHIPRGGWEKAFKLMHERKEDLLLIEESIDSKMEAWEWK